MSVQVNSTTDLAEAIVAAQGDAVVPAEVSVEEKPVEKEVAPTEEVPPVETPEEAHKRKGGFQKKIEKLSTRVAQTEQERDYWREQALKAAPPKTEPQPASPVGKPDPEKYDTNDAYIEALTDWKVGQALEARDVKTRQQEAEKALSARVETFQARIQQVRQEHPDFDERMEAADDVPLSGAVREVVLGSEVGPELLYELAKDTKELARICSMPALAAAKELGRIEARVLTNGNGGQATNGKKTTSAPSPVKPVAAKSGAGASKPLDEMSYQEFKRAREAGKV